MKQSLHFFYVLLALFIAPGLLSAQDYFDIPPLDDEGNPPLVYMIAGDTTDTGERVNPDRVYRLQRGAIYVLNATLIANYPLHIVAAEAVDENDRPPIIVSGKFADGVNIRPMMEFIGDGTRHKFENIIFNGVDLDRQYDGEWIRGLVFTADNISASFQGCVFNCFTGGATRFEGANASIYFRDCVWRNGVWASHMFVGQQMTMPELPVDTLVVTNNTYFNNNAFWLFQENDLIKYAVIEHNTVYTSLVDMMRLRYSSNASIRSNIFYGTHAYGDSEESQDGQWYEPDHSSYSIISLYEVPSDILEDAGLTEADRTVVLTHNAYFAPQAIQDYWTATDGVNGPAWINERTQALFDDEAGHPFMLERDNYNEDPNFTDTVMDEWVTGKVADFCTTYRATLTPGQPLSGNAGELRNYDEEQGVDILGGIQWPLPESMAYQNATLLTGAHDGLPVGDLNWDPASRALYVETTEITTSLSTPSTPTSELYLLGQNRPNPFSSLTVFSFNVPTQGTTTLKLYDMTGSLVKTLVDDVLTVGAYEYEFDASNLAAGTYFYQLQSGSFSSVKKMTVIK